MAQVGRAAREAFGEAIPVLAENMKTIFPDDEARKAFCEKGLQEFKSGEIHFALQMYQPCVFILVLIIVGIW